MPDKARMLCQRGTVMADSELLIFNDDRLSRQLNDLYARMSESPAELAAFLVNPAGVVHGVHRPRAGAKAAHAAGRRVV